MPASRKDESLFELLTWVNWRWSVLLAGLCYLFLGVMAPAICRFTSCGLVVQPMTDAASFFAPFLSVFILFFGGVSAFKDYRKRKRLDATHGIESIMNIDPFEFEELVGEYYRRRGFRVIENQQRGPDGGVDLRIKDVRGTHLVQCKRWRDRNVGVSTVRELFGVMNAEFAAGAILATTSDFTEDAKEFAFKNSMTLVDGPTLLKMVDSVQRSTQSLDEPNHGSVSDDIRACPRCGAELVRRTAKRGKHAGSSFYGCSSFPKCRHTET